MANPLDVQELVGEETAEARAWLRNIKKYIAAQTVNTPGTRLDSAAAALFGVHIAEGSPAQTWFAGLTIAQRTSYVNLLREFDVKWPPIPPAPTPLRQVLEEFDQYVLTVDDIGQRVPTGHGGATDWAHKIFAQRLHGLGMRTTLPDAALVMRAMDQHIPPAVRELMQPYASRSWRDWCNALEELDNDSIVARQRLYTRIEELERQQAQISSQTAARARQTPRAPAQHAGTTFQPHQYPPPAPAADAQSNQRPDVATQPPPASPANHARVERERQDWTTQYPDGRVFASRPYPLTPGTASAAVGCSRCGAPEGPTHNRFLCASPNPLPELEQRYRASVKTQMLRAQQQTPAGRGQLPPPTPGAFSPSPWRGRGRGGWGAPGTPSPVHHIAAYPPQPDWVDDDDELEEEDEEAVVVDIAGAGNGSEAAQ